MRQAEISLTAVRDHLETILRSRAFAKSERMSRFLRFIVEHTLTGRASELKQYSVGLAIFDRDEKFDPQLDPIVRVEARRLREKLRLYYETDGAGDVLAIELPSGSYVPRFHLRRPELSEWNLAVRPFEGTALADGLTDELIHALARLDGVRVREWSAAAAQTGAVLVGRAHEAAGCLRVLARLVDHAGAVLWAETFDRRITNPFVTQESLAWEVADAIGNWQRRSLVRSENQLIPQAGGHNHARAQSLAGPILHAEFHRLQRV